MIHGHSSAAARPEDKARWEARLWEEPLLPRCRLLVWEEVGTEESSWGCRVNSDPETTADLHWASFVENYLPRGFHVPGAECALELPQ